MEVKRTNSRRRIASFKEGFGIFFGKSRGDVRTHVICEVGGRLREVVEVRLADVSVLYDQVYGHFAFQAADVPVAEVVAELVNLRDAVLSFKIARGFF